MDEDPEKGKIKLSKGDPDDWFTSRAWAIRCFAKQIEEIAMCSRKLARVCEKVPRVSRLCIKPSLSINHAEFLLEAAFA